MSVAPSVRRRFPLLAALAVFVLSSLAYIGPVFAQTTISIVNQGSLVRLDKDGNPTTKRPLTLNPEAVNYQDCVDDQRIRFTLLMGSLVPNSSVQVWASPSGGCDTQINRTSSNKICWQVAPNVPLQQQVNVDIPVRKIMSGAPPNSAVSPNDSADICGKVALSNISVEFLYFDPGNVANASQKVAITIQVNTVGPAPPTGLKILPGNTRLQVSWNNISGEGGVTSLTGITVYCDPAQASAPTTVEQEASCTEVPITPEASTTEADADAGDATTTIEDAGFETVCNDGGATTVAGSDCSSPNFVGADGQPIVPDKTFNAKYQCGSIAGNIGTTVVADNVGGNPLVNGTRYAVSVAATDQWGNIGRLSAPICDMPEQTNDFWDSYRAAGGQAGGGFCNASPGTPAGSLAALGLVAAAAISSLRRSRRSSASKERG